MIWAFNLDSDQTLLVLKSGGVSLTAILASNCSCSSVLKGFRLVELSGATCKM